MSAIRHDPLTLAEAARIMREAPGPRIWLYAFQAGPGGPIKIGISRNPKQRLATLQRATAETLIPRAAWRGFPFEEKQIHAEYADARLRGEWFEPVPDLLKLVDAYGDNYDSWDE